jgi:hypothetical protein
MAEYTFRFYYRLPQNATACGSLAVMTMGCSNVNMKEVAMKVIIIEGSPEELADYEARTGMIGPAHSDTNVPEQAGDPLAAVDGKAISGTEDVAKFRSFISRRARGKEIGASVEEYIRQVLGLGMTVTTGTGRSNSLYVYTSLHSWYGALANVNTTNANLKFRLTKDDVADLTDPRIRPRDVQPSDQYQINCLVTEPEAIDLAVKLTQRARDKAIRLRNGDPAG